MTVLVDVGDPSLKVGGTISFSWFGVPGPYWTVVEWVPCATRAYIYSFSLLLTG